MTSVAEARSRLESCIRVRHHRSVETYVQCIEDFCHAILAESRPSSEPVLRDLGYPNHEWRNVRCIQCGIHVADSKQNSCPGPSSEPPATAGGEGQQTDLTAVRCDESQEAVAPGKNGEDPGTPRVGVSDPTAGDCDSRGDSRERPATQELRRIYEGAFDGFRALYEAGERAERERNKVEDSLRIQDDIRGLIAERVMYAFHIYPNYRVDSGGPYGCLMEILRAVRPDIAEAFSDDGDANRVYARFFDSESGEAIPPAPPPPAPAEKCPECLLSGHHKLQCSRQPGPARVVLPATAGCK